MKKSVLLGLTLLLSTAWLLAQDTMGSQTSSSSSNETTIQGCLSNSGGSFLLTDAAGVQYQLQGDSSQLSSNVDKEVQAKGTASASGPSPAEPSAGSGAGSSAPNAPQVFNVSKVKKISDTCKASK